MMADAVRGTKSDPNHRGAHVPAEVAPKDQARPRRPNPATPPAGPRLNSPTALTAQHRAILILPKVDDRLGHTARLAPHRRRSSLANARPAPSSPPPDQRLHRFTRAWPSSRRDHPSQGPAPINPRPRFFALPFTTHCSPRPPLSSPGYFTPNLTQCISQRPRSPTHRSHRADKESGSVTSVRTSVRSGKKIVFGKVGLMRARGTTQVTTRR